ncbi:MAG: hypothetical protein Q9162_007796 [Coniocarpon cinnabarinum]
MESIFFQARYAPHTWRFLAACIASQQNDAARAAPKVDEFLRQYPEPEYVVRVPPSQLKPFFQGLRFDRTEPLHHLARALIENPPKPYAISGKHSSRFPSKPSEVAHLPGIGDFASDAWCIFCREQFYKQHGQTSGKTWRDVHPQHPVLQAVVNRKWEEEHAAATTRMPMPPNNVSNVGGAPFLLRDPVFRAQEPIGLGVAHLVDKNDVSGFSRAHSVDKEGVSGFGSAHSVDEDDISHSSHSVEPDDDISDIEESASDHSLGRASIEDDQNINLKHSHDEAARNTAASRPDVSIAPVTQVGHTDDFRDLNTTAGCPDQGTRTASSSSEEHEASGSDQYYQKPFITAPKRRRSSKKLRLLKWLTT